ncbi:MAG: hypothetical protein JNK48_27700 [Bryobacterales bacterium]|nr:hypothetical protein [Bryobacterales bacterium]
MFALKPISPASVPGALAKAERYRLLNEPSEAESICRDVLEVDPQHQQARISLVLALTDRIPEDARAFTEAIANTAHLEESYDRAYFAGIAWERRARARLNQGGHDSHHQAYDWILRAMGLFEMAEKVRADGNDDAVLRWNTCVRMLREHPELGPREQEASAPILSE